MQPCKIGWCVSFAAPESEFCVIHKSAPKFAPSTAEVTTGLWTFEYEREDCELCNGEGEHECSEDRCGAYHECGACEGEGTQETFRAKRTDTFEVREYDQDAFERAFPEVDVEALKKGATP